MAEGSARPEQFQEMERMSEGGVQPLLKTGLALGGGILGAMDTGGPEETVEEDLTEKVTQAKTPKATLS